MPLPLLLLRAVFLTVAAAIGATFAIQHTRELHPSIMFAAVMALALTVVGADMGLKNKSLTVISSIYFGAIVGLFLSYVSNLALQVLPLDTRMRDPLQLVLSTILVYLCISLLLQTRNDFRFIIPYVEFAREVKGVKPFVLDVSALADGRFADLVETKVIDNKLVVPQFVLEDLNAMVAGSDRIRRERGKLGLKEVQRLQQMEGVELELFERELPEFAGQSNEQKLVVVAKHFEGKIVANDVNLENVSKVRGVACVNLNAIALALRELYPVGAEFKVRITGPGSERTQGIGHLPDGTRVVVENGRGHINREAWCTVTKIHPTPQGKMIFARFDREAGDEVEAAATGDKPAANA